jgi:micrococcal nuclease
MNKRLIFLLLVLCLASPAWAFVARTKNVHDGDSITVRRSNGHLVNVRLYGVDAPERKQPSGLSAKKLLISLASRQTLDVQPMDTDRYGRTVALVRLPDGTLLNEVMVAEGLAWVYGQYCKEAFCPRWKELEDQARREGRGLWAAADPVRPSDWRAEHKAEEWYQTPVRAMKRMAKSVKRTLRL